MIARWALRVIVAMLVGLTVVAVRSGAWAQSRPSIRAAALPSDVEVGQVFVFRLTAMVSVSDQPPDKPSLSLPAGFVLRGGPRVMPQTQVSITNGQMQQSVGIEVSWQVEARAAGRHTIGPASVLWQGKRFESGRVQVNVHPPGTLPRRQDPFDLFDIFGLPKMPGGFPDFPQIEEPSLPPPDPALAMAAPLARTVFLRAEVDKTDCVLGEQVTLRVYEYVSGGAPRQVEAHEPPAVDFLQRPLLSPDDEPPVRYAEVGGEMWRVRLIRKVALFPLKVGTLTVGPMDVDYQGAGLRARTPRHTTALQVRVANTPEQGRPVGYRAGDVGQFSLSSEVTPTAVEQGGSIAVTVKLAGVGNLPLSLDVPRRKGVEWLDPTTRDKTDVTDDDRVRGERVFTYVVRMLEPGAVDLGAIELPFYNPWHHAYEVASTRLGVVHVTPSAQPVSSAPEALDRFASVGPLRRELTPAPARSRLLTDSPLFWVGLAGGPAGVLLLGAAASVWRGARARVSAWRDSLRRHAAVALREAREAAARGAVGEAAAAAERALHIGLEASCGLKSRGVLRDDLARELQSRGIQQQQALLASEILSRCERLRFEPGADAGQATKLVEDLGNLLDALPRPRKAKDVSS